MSDEEEHRMQEDSREIHTGGQGEDQEMEEVVQKKKSTSKRTEGEEEEEDEDEDDEDDEEERRKKRTKLRHKRLNRFLDIEAEVSDEDEEEEEEEGEGEDTFFTNVDEPEEESTRRNHALLNRNFTAEDKSPEEIANAIEGRYRDRPAPYTGDMSEIPQRLLMPSVHDASLWQVRVKPGRERDIVFSLMRKAIDVEYTASPLSIMSAFQRDSLPGMIYVEARSAKQVQQACFGLVGVYPSRGLQLVPIEEMASLLLIKKQDVTLTPGTWVRIRRGKYAGDLAQVMDLTENGEEVGIRLIPRIDMNPRDDASLDPANKKRKKGTTATGTTRPPQRLFNFDEVSKVYGKSITRKNQVYVFQSDTYRDGFLEKDFKVSGLIMDDVNPTLDEITQFARQDDGGEDSSINLSAIAEASRKAAIAVLQPGDHVEVFEGEQAGIHGIVEEVSGDVVTMTAQGLDMDGQKMEIPARSVRKKFKPGDHVKVMAGQHADETGLVVSVADNVVTFVSDMTMQEISVFAKDLRTAAEVGTGSNIVGNYELHDLVQLDAQTVGVIFKTERDSFRVLDQNGQVRLVQPHQISMRRDSSRAIATDSEGHELRVNDNVKEVDGEGRKGRVLHTHQSFFAFLHNREIAESGGVFVTRTRSLASLAPKSNVLKNTGTDLSKMNPAMVAPTGGMVGSGMTRGPRDRDIGTTVTVVKGPHKGYVGTIKDTNGHIARVELRTGNKIIMIEKEKIYRRLSDGKLEPLDRPRRGYGNMGPPRQGGIGNPYANSGNTGQQNVVRTPFGGRTPNPYADGGKTPAWNASSRTPNPYGDGNKTPAWNALSKTPNPYANDGGKTPGWGGKTPAWSTSGSKTPNPYGGGGGGGGGTSTVSGWGGATPGRNPGWGGTSPPRPSGAGAGGAGAGEGGGGGGWGSDDWSGPSRSTYEGWQSAPTPTAATTPGVHLGQTPAYAPTTPGVGQTPAAVWSAPAIAATPAMIPSYARPGDEMVSDFDENWLFNDKDHTLSNYIPRIKVVIKGTKGVQYLNGDYEDKVGRIVAAQRNPDAFEQTARVRFDNGEERSFLVKYIMPQGPKLLGEEVLVFSGKQRGVELVVRETPDNDMVVVSTRQNPVEFDYVPMKNMVALAAEDVGR